MKTINKYITIIILLFCGSYSFSQDPPCDLPTPYIINIPEPSNYVNGELIIYNMTLFRNSERADTIKVRMIPIGAFYNGDFHYIPKSAYQFNSGDSTKITGTEIYIPPQTDANVSSRKIGNFDKGGGFCDFSYGFAKYKFEFYRLDTTGGSKHWEYVNHVYIDFRDAGNNNLPYQYGGTYDFRIDYFSRDTITLQHHPHADNYPNYYLRYWNINYVNKDIKIWNLFGTCLTALIPDKKIFFTDSSNNGAYLKIPINANQYNHNIGHEDPGDLGMNLIVIHDVTTRDTLIDTITDILIPTKGFLKINNNKIFNMITPISPENGTNNLIVQDSSFLILSGNSELIVGGQNKLTLKNKGQITLQGGSKLRFQSGSSFCNLGGLIKSIGSPPGIIIYEKGSYIICREIVEYPIGDSTKIILEDSTTLEIPDSTILHFSGSQSGLIMKPNSKLKMGDGSKILFDSGASVFANGAIFTSIDSTLKWDGIVLSNSDADTITNCTFSNAVTALTIRNDANASYKNRIITGNTFNIPSGGNCKGIYGENNYRILIKNNTFNMPVYNSIVNPPEIVYVGVYLKNSGTGGSAGETEENEESPYSLNIVGNTFSNGCASVILANYLSNLLPYNISKNTFNDAATVNLIGMQITGRIKNNNFTSDNVPLGIHLISSDPELYNNTVESRDVALHLSGHCYPKLGPYLSGSDLIWAGGKNSLSSLENDNIQLSSAGIVYSDWGNNSFNVTDSSSYHIFGFADSALTTFYARDNCWNNSGNALLSITKYNTQFIVPTVYYNASYECNYTPYVTG